MLKLKIVMSNEKKKVSVLEGDSGSDLNLNENTKWLETYSPWYIIH